MPPTGFDPYRTLGVPRSATTLEIARARRRLAKRLHPDVGGDAAATEMRAVNRAWQILSDAGRRRDWDDQHAPLQAHWAPRTTRPRPAEQRWTQSEPAYRQPPPASKPAEPSSIRDSGWLAAVIASALVVGLLVVAWLASDEVPARSVQEALDGADLPVVGVVPLDDATELVLTWQPEELIFDVRGELGIAPFYRVDAGWEAGIGWSRPVFGDESVILHTNARAPGPWRSYVFGTASANVVQVRVPGYETAGGMVDGGRWALGIRDAVVLPADLRWEMLGADGETVLSGRGQRHCLGC